MNPFERLLEDFEENVPDVKTTSPTLAKFDVEGFLARHNLKSRPPDSWNGGGQIWRLDGCPINPTDHTGNCAAIMQHKHGALTFKCHHTSCSGIGWKELRELLEPAQLRSSAIIKQQEHKKFRIEDIQSIWQIDATQTWLVDDLIPEAAVTLLTGDSGSGKSTFTVALAGAVAYGTSFIGKKTLRRKVLYVDRENPLAVIKDRLARLGIEETEQLIYWGAFGKRRHLVAPLTRQS